MTETSFEAVALRAREAAQDLALATRATKDAALLAMADALVAACGPVLEANAEDVATARAGGTGEGLVDRLRLDEARVRAMADGLREVYFHEIVNYLRLTPYKIRQNPDKGLVFAGATLMLLNRYRERFAR